MDWIVENWALVLVGETLLILWLLTRPSPRWSLLLRPGRTTSVRHAAGRPLRSRHTEPSRQPAGVVARIHVHGPEANVRLVDNPNRRRMLKGKRYAYVGGHYKESPIELTVPWNGMWSIFVDVGVEPAHFRATYAWVAADLPAPLSRPTEQPHRLAMIHKLGRTSKPTEERDVFISYASEDKDSVAKPLTDALIGLGVSVWLDEYELRIGDGLRGMIDEGIARSRFGVVVLSPDFFVKNWTRYALNGMVAKKMNGDQVILPVWHRLTKDEVLARSPSLLDMIARSTSEFTIAEIAREIADVVGVTELDDDDTGSDDFEQAWK